MKKTVSLWFALAFGVASIHLAAAEDTNAVLTLAPSSNDFWAHGIGEGFKSSAQSFGIEAGASYGFAILGGSERHDLALLDLCYSHMLGGVRGEGHFYRGNFEFRAELFGGSQFSPRDEWVVGISPHLRYDFATGTRLVPFFDLGMGVTGTGIAAPDLSGGFEFNLECGPGAYWFITDRLALTGEARFMHISCADISSPNLGLNTILGLVGISYFF